MYKLFVMVASGSYSAGRCIATQTIEFETRTMADLAYDLLSRASLDCESNIVKLY